MSENSQNLPSPAGPSSGFLNLPARCRALIERSHEGVMLVNAEGIIVYASPSISRISGFVTEELLGRHLFDSIHPDDAPAERTFLAQIVLKPGATETRIARFRRKIGGWLWLEGVVTNLLAEPDIQAIVINYRDVTARQEAEEVLRKTRDQLRFVLSATPTVLYACTVDEVPRLKFLSDSVTELLGYTVEEILVNPTFWITLVHPDDPGVLLPRTPDGALLDEAVVDYRARHQDGSWRWLRDHARILRDAEGHPVEMVGSIVDITKEREIEDRLKATEKRLHLLLSTTECIVFSCAPAPPYNVNFVTENVEAIFGYPHRDWIEIPGFWMNHVHPEDLKRLLDARPRNHAQGHFSVEYRFLAHDGAYRWVFSELQLIRDAQSQPVELAGIGVDVTARKRVEADLWTTRERLQFLLTATPAVLFVTRAAPEPICEFISDNVRSVLGYEPSDFLGPFDFWLNQLHPEDRATVATATTRLYAEGSSACEYRFRHKDGSWRWLHASARVLRDASGTPVQNVGCWLDISERKEAEAAQRENERRASSLLNAVNHPMFLLDLQGNILAANIAMAQRMGRSVEDLINSNVEQFVPLELAKPRNAWAAEVVRTGKPVRFEDERAGIQMDNFFSPVFDSAGRVTAITVFSMDITARKQAEAQLQLQAMLLNQISDTVTATDLEGRITYVNDAQCRKMGRSREELVGRLVTVFGEALEKGATQQQIIETTRSRGEWRGEVVNRDRNGRELVMDSRTILVRDEQGRPIGLCGTATDITERKRSDEARQALAHRLIEVQETERRALAHELHDEVGQTLTLLKLALEQCLSANTADSPAKLERARNLLLDLIARVRNMSLDLRPSMLDDLGLLPALLWQIERFTNQTGIQITFTQVGLEGHRFGPHIETAVFRVVQEALTNTARYSGVKRATVFLEASAHSLHLQVQDSGAGFDVEAALASGKSSGLRGMFERVRLLGGQMQVNSDPGAGTFLTAELPLEGRNDSPGREDLW